MSQTEPDADAIKMFVGQLPRNWDEAAVRALFEEYGPIHNMNILRDKATGGSRGCAFVTYYTRKAALSAQNALHDVKTLPTMHHAIQMRPADSEKKAEERKLFVGMVNKKYSENDVRKMFSPYGTIEECTVLRDSTGTVSRGCAFVTFTTRAAAHNAISNMHHSQIMDGCTSALVVKFADTQKEKEQRRAQHMNQNMWNNSGSSGAPCFGNVNPNYLAQLLQQLVNTNQAGNAGANMGGGNFGNQSSPQGMGMGGVNLQQLLATAAAAAGNNPALLATLASLGSMIANGQGNPAGLNSAVNNNQGFRGNQFGMGNSAGGLGNSMAGGNSMHGFGTNNSNNLDAITQAYSGIQQFAATFPGSFGNPPAHHNSANVGGKQTEGPDGANLFIYHLPQESTDADLMSMFSPFGSVISAKVFIDKQTNLSKCFGFVSYDNCSSATNAIQSMNGFQLGTKRLKVQLKRPKNDGKPY